MEYLKYFFQVLALAVGATVVTVLWCATQVFSIVGYTFESVFGIILITAAISAIPSIGLATVLTFVKMFKEAE